MAQDTNLKIVYKTARSDNRKQHAIGWEYLHIGVEGGQLTIGCTAGVRGERRDQFIAARNGKSPRSTKKFGRTFRKTEHYDLVSSGIVADKFCDKHPQERTKRALMTLEEATEWYMVEVIADSSFWMQQLIT